MPPENLNVLAERKQLLILQAELHRAVLETQVANVRSQWLWLRQVREKLPGGAWWLAGGAVAGFVVLRRWRSTFKWLPAVWSAWRLLKKARSS